MPSISDMILPYGNVRILAQYLNRQDLQNLALTSKAHYEYIQASPESFTTLLKLGRCNNGSRRWKRDDLQNLEGFMLRSRHNSLMRSLSNYLCCYLRRPTLSEDGFNPCEFEYVKARLQAEHDQLPCEDVGGGYSAAKSCFDCGLPVCNICRVHSDYRAAIDDDGKAVFVDELYHVSSSEYDRLHNLARDRCDIGIEAVDLHRNSEPGPFAVARALPRRRGHPICSKCVPLIADSSAPEKCECTGRDYYGETFGDHWKCIQCFLEELTAIYVPSKTFRKDRDGPDFYRCINQGNNSECLGEMEVEDEQPFRVCLWCGLQTDPVYEGVEVY